MSKVLWVFIQSFKIRGKEKKKKPYCFVECVSYGVLVCFFCTGNSKRCVGRAVYRFSYGERKGIDDFALATQHRGIKRLKAVFLRQPAARIPRTVFIHRLAPPARGIPASANEWAAEWAGLAGPTNRKRALRSGRSRTVAPPSRTSTPFFLRCGRRDVARVT